MRKLLILLIAGLLVSSSSLWGQSIEYVGSCQSLGGYAHGLFVSGDHAYIANHTDGSVHHATGLQVVDVSNPWMPYNAGSYSTIGYPMGVFVQGERAYLAMGFHGLYIFDISNPTNPLVLGSYDTPGLASNVFVVNNTAYVADVTSLQVFDVLNPSNPTLIGSCYLGTASTNDVAVSGSRAYVAGSRGLIVLNVSNPSEPTKLNTCHLPSMALAVTLTDHFAFVADGQSGLQIINRFNLNLVGSYDTTGSALDVYVSGDYAYVAMGYYMPESPRYGGGVLAVNIQNVSNPTLTSSYYSPGNAYDARGVVVRDTLIFLTRGIGGLNVLKFNPQMQQQTGYISVHAMGYEAPCNPTINLAAANVRIYNQDLSYDESFTTNEVGMIDHPIEVPVGEYSVEVSYSGYMTNTKPAFVNYEGYLRSIRVGLYPEISTLFATIPEDGETVNDTKTAITLAFSKPMDLNALNDLNLLTILVNGIHKYPNQDYFIVQSKQCPETYHLYGDPDNETEIEFGLDKRVDVVVSSELLDEDGHQLGQDYSFYFETKSEYLSASQKTLTGNISGGHYLGNGTQVVEETEYKIGIKGDLYPDPEQTVTYSLEISSNGSWATTLPHGPEWPEYPDIIQGERRFFTGLNGSLRIRMYDNSAAVLLKQVKYKFHVRHPFTKEELIIEMAPQQIDKPTCLDYLWMADPNYQALLTDICTAIPVLGSIYRLLNAAGAALYDDRYECGFYDVPQIEVSDFLETDPSVYDYYSVPLSFDNIANDISTSTGFRVYKAIVEIPIRFDRSTPLDLGLIFKPWVSTFTYYADVSKADPPVSSGLQNQYASPQPSNDFVTPNGQYWYGYQCDVNTGRSPNLPPTNIAHDPALPNSVLDDGRYTGFREEKAAFCGVFTEPIPTLGRPVQLVLRGPENVTTNAVMHYRLTIKPWDEDFVWDKHAGYLFLQFDDNLVSLGAHDETQTYGSLRDIEVVAYSRDFFGNEEVATTGRGGFPVLDIEPLGNLPMLKSFLFDVSLFMNLPGEVSATLSVLGLFDLFWSIAKVDGAKKGFDYAAPFLIPDPILSKTENDLDLFKVGLFVDQQDNPAFNSKRGVCSLVVDIPLIFHDPAAHFDIKYYGRPWKQMDMNCKVYSLQDMLPVECGEHHYFIWYHVTPSEPLPAMIVKAFSPISLQITDPDGNVVSRDQSSVAGATYTEYDTDLDGTNECEIVITQPLDGQYQIEAISNPDADPLDEYSMSVTWAGQGTVLADNVLIQDIPSRPYVFNVSLQPMVFGTVSEVGGSGLAGVTVDVFDSTGSLVASIPTNTDGSYECVSLSPGLYTVSVVPPLGYGPTYNNVETRLWVGSEKEFSFYLNSKEHANEARGVGYWKHQVNVYLSGKGNAQESLEQMSGYMNLIATHFNGNLANPVNIFDVPQPATQNDSLEALQALLSVRGKVGMNEKAKKHLTALLLNVASLKLHQTTIISEDSATASQGITYCYQLITDDNSDNDEAAKDIAEMINEGLIVPAGMIDPSTANIAYKQNNTEQLPTEFALHQNYPNPFNPATEISFSLPNAADVKLEIFNIMGQRVATLADQHLEAGNHGVIWDGSHVASGVYFYRLEAGDFVESRKMVLLK